MIIDCHGHYTTAPKSHDVFRDAQLKHFGDPSQPLPLYPDISDDDIRESIEANQLRLLRERGADMTIFSPRASTMAHHEGDEAVSQIWTRHCNDLIARVTGLYPEAFIGVCQLPQSRGVTIKNSIAELERCVNELGFVGCNLNPDPSGGHWDGPPLTDRAWYPFFEKMVELDVPAMIHVSGSCNANFHATARTLHQRRYHGVHAVPAGRPVQGFPKLALRHPAWRRRGAVPLGPLSRPG
jgi:4-oxalmesaconate hydratase